MAGFFVGIPLGNDDTPQSQRVSDIAVRVLLDDDLRDLHAFTSPTFDRGGTVRSMFGPFGNIL